MKARLVPVFIAVSVFIVAALVGRYLILPALHGRTVTAQSASAPADQQISAVQASPAMQQTQSAFDECYAEAIRRRVDPIEARHTCNVIADSI